MSLGGSERGEQRSYQGGGVDRASLEKDKWTEDDEEINKAEVWI